MVAQIGIWSVGPEGPHRVERSRVNLESDLEDWCAADPLLLLEGLRIVGRQVHCEGGYIDLLGIDAQERWVVIELKRARLYREALIQALDYAASIRRMDARTLREAIKKSTGILPDAVGSLKAVDFQLQADESGREISIVVAGAGVDPGLDRVTDFLGGFEVPIKVISFDVFEQLDGTRLLMREVLDEGEGAQTASKKRKIRTVAQITETAENAGLGEPFRQLLAAAEGAGLFCRPYVHSVMVAPASNKGRFLMVLTPQGESGIRFNYGPTSFAEFFNVDASEVEKAIGAEGSDKDTFLTSDNWEPLVARITGFLESLPEEVGFKAEDGGTRD